MTVDEVVKLVLAFSVAFSLVFVAFHLGRLLGKLAETIGAARKSIDNVSKITDMATEDYESIREEVRSAVGVYQSVKNGLASTALSTVLGLLGSGRKKDETEDQELEEED